MIKLSNKQQVDGIIIEIASQNIVMIKSIITDGNRCEAMSLIAGFEKAIRKRSLIVLHAVLVQYEEFIYKMKEKKDD